MGSMGAAERKLIVGVINGGEEGEGGRRKDFENH